MLPLPFPAVGFAARRLRYEPAAQGGEPVQVWGRLPVIFPIPEQEAEPTNVETP